jgi:hypothetical protein
MIEYVSISLVMATPERRNRGIGVTFASRVAALRAWRNGIGSGTEAKAVDAPSARSSSHGRISLHPQKICARGA